MNVKTFIVAIPLFDADMSVPAYRLCDRNAAKLFGTANDFQAMGEYLLSPGLNLVHKVGIEPFTGGKPLLADINQYLLLMGAPTNLNIPPELLVCVLPKDIPQDEAILKKCETLLHLGYTLGIQGFPLHAPESPLVNMASYIVLNRMDKDFSAEIKAMGPYMGKKQTVLCNLPDMSSYESAKGMRGGLFAGTFYRQPIAKNAGGISPVKINAMRLLKQVQEEDFELSDSAKIVERDPAISISLLRFINSPAVGLGRRVNSIRGAVAILGQMEMKRWVNVAVSVALAEDRPSELTKLSLVRAKFAENLSSAYRLAMLSGSLFIAGLFSMLDVILEKPMPEALQEISVDDRVREALLERKGPIYEVLDMIYAYEKADWDKVSINMIRNSIDPEEISEAFIASLIWYKELLTSIDEEDELL